MRIRYAPYKLEGLGNIRDRLGALLEFTFEDDSMGYADCHPWKELGDEPLKEQFSLLRSGRLTKITARSLDFAMLDSSARCQKINLLQGLTIPKNHFFVTSTDVPENYLIYKCKDPQLCLDLLPRLRPEQKVRMDFNFRISRGQFIEFIGRIKPFSHHFDYIEDPFTFNEKLWRDFEKQFGISLALDREHKGEDFPLRIIKPAIDTPVDQQKEKRFIYTSYLDHPIGQVSAAFVAAKSKCQEVCGLATHLVYKENVFSRCLTMSDSTMCIPFDGYGFGFDDLLSEQQWRSL